jgi:hypothetical protein
MDYYKDYNKQIKIYKLFKNNLEVIYKRKDKDLLDSISYLILIYYKYYHKLNNHWLYNHI